MRTNILLLSIVSVGLSGTALAAPHFEGFEDPSWTQGGTNWNNFNSDIMRVSSGNAGITSATGNGHAIITNLGTVLDVFGNPSVGGAATYTQFGGYSSTFGAGWTTSLDIYLDADNWTDGQGFDYSSAANGSDGNHQRDFIFNVGMVGGELLVNGSNNSDISYNDYIITTANGGDYHTVIDSGWYTFEHVFNNVGGVLSVDLNLRDNLGTLLHSITRTSVADTIPGEVGGNRYGYFSYNNIDGLAIDNTSLSVVPAPGSVALLGFGGLVATRRRRA
tara:strand:+ start:75935 stop:76762 length:828 start_codon:yes stop_codon:yes gene_type:complete